MIRIFVGADGRNCDLESQVVLEYTIRKHASEPVEIAWMQQAATGHWSGWKTKSARTPFSHFRWSVPAVCGYQGRAIYMDSDFFVLADLAELWRQEIPGVLLLKSTEGKLNTSCLMFDCAKAKGYIPDLPTLKALPDANGTMHQHLRGHREQLAAFDGDWNCIDGGKYVSLDDPRIKAIHYSRIETQVHLRHALLRLAKEGGSHWYTGETFQHPRGDLQVLFDLYYAEAIAAGYTVDRYRVTPFAGSTRRAFVYRQHKGMPA